MISYKIMAVKLKKSINDFINFVLGERCLLCSSPLSNNRFPLICNNCVDNTRKLLGNRCQKCGIPLPDGTAICERCKYTEYSFSENISIFDYRDWNIKRLIFQYKFKKRKSLAEYLAFIYFDIIKRTYRKILVVPVPTSNKSKRKRGWGHMEIIAKILDKEYGIQTIELLKAKPGTKQQKNLSLEERKESISGKFSIKKNQIKKLNTYDKRDLILIDDVFTTGATADECAKILREEGFTTVHVITLAID